MDFRIQSTIEKLRQSLGAVNGEYDLISIPGGAGSIGQLVEYVSLSARLHNAKKFILTVHEDCGAGKTKDDLLKAIEYSKKIFGNCEISGYFIKLDGTWEEVEG